MRRAEAHKIALAIMQKHLEPHWYNVSGWNRLTLRGVQVRKAIADAVQEAHEEGRLQGHREAKEEQ